MTKIVLDKTKRKSAICNREEYFLKYGVFDKSNHFKNMVKGAPKIINICGIYYYLDKLAEITKKGKKEMDNFILECKEPIDSKERVVFVWE